MAAHLMLLVFCEIKSLRRCVLFHLVWLIACVYVPACMTASVCLCAGESERVIVCFRLRAALVSSDQYAAAVVSVTRIERSSV